MPYVNLRYQKNGIHSRCLRFENFLYRTDLANGNRLDRAARLKQIARSLAATRRSLREGAKSVSVLTIEPFTEANQQRHHDGEVLHRPTSLQVGSLLPQALPKDADHVCTTAGNVAKSVWVIQCAYRNAMNIITAAKL